MAQHEIKNKDGLTPLQLACQAGSLTVVELLWEHQPSLAKATGGSSLLGSSNTTSGKQKRRRDRKRDLLHDFHLSRMTPLEIAAFSGRHDVLTLLCNKMHRRLRAEHLAAPLVWCTESGHTECVHVLCERMVTIRGVTGATDIDACACLSGAMFVAIDRGALETLEVLSSHSDILDGGCRATVGTTVGATVGAAAGAGAVGAGAAGLTRTTQTTWSTILGCRNLQGDNLLVACGRSMKGKECLEILCGDGRNLMMRSELRRAESHGDGTNAVVCFFLCSLFFFVGNMIFNSLFFF